MTRRMPARVALATPVLLLGLVVAGCTSDFLVDPGAAPQPTPSPTATMAEPLPSPTATTDPVPGFEADDCGELRINAPGHYVIGDCTKVILEGAGIELRAGRIGELVLRGDRIEVEADGIVQIDVSGQGNELTVDATVLVRISGDDNRVVTLSRVREAIVSGNDNVVTSPLGFGGVSDSGERNYVGVPQSTT